MLYIHIFSQSMRLRSSSIKTARSVVEFFLKLIGMLNLTNLVSSVSTVVAVRLQVWLRYAVN